MRQPLIAAVLEQSHPEVNGDVIGCGYLVGAYMSGVPFSSCATQASCTSLLEHMQANRCWKAQGSQQRATAGDEWLAWPLGEEHAGPDPFVLSVAPHQLLDAQPAHALQAARCLNLHHRGDAGRPFAQEHPRFGSLPGGAAHRSADQCSPRSRGVLSRPHTRRAALLSAASQAGVPASRPAHHLPCKKPSGGPTPRGATSAQGYQPAELDNT